MYTKKSINRTMLIAATALVILSLLGPTSLSATALPQTQSYIVQGTSTDLVAALVEKIGGTTTSRLDIIQGVGALLTPQAANALRNQAGIKAVTTNSSVKVADEGGEGQNSPATDYPDVTGADLVWNTGVIGSGVTVAIVDTGFSLHRGIVRNTRGRTTNRILAWVDFVQPRSHVPRDPNGHGTHIAGIIANSQKGADNEWNGMAPGVSLVGVRVLDENGEGNYERVIQGIQWVINHKSQYNIRVINLSLVSPVQSPYWADPLDQAVMQAWANGIVVVAAAGNSGPSAMSVGVPGNTPYIITVGAFTDNYTPLDWNDDYITPFSAAGPTLDGFVKPDVVAPGAHIVSTMMPWQTLARDHQANQVTNHYFAMAGTSQSAAVVSGLAALIISGHPELNPNQVKFRIMVTAFPWIDPTTTNALYSMWQQGTGRVNAPDAVASAVVDEANLGMDVLADLAGTIHYQGYSYYDETTGQFRLADPYADWAGGYGQWSGGYGQWSGGYGQWSGGYGQWSGGYGQWSGGYGQWSGGYGSWSGGYGSWSGGYGSWSGGYGSWSGGYGSWSGGYGSWSGSEPWAGSIYSDPAYVSNYIAGVSPDSTAATTSVGNWIEEP